MLLDLSYAVPNLFMSLLSFSVCNGFLSIRGQDFVGEGGRSSHDDRRFRERFFRTKFHGQRTFAINREPPPGTSLYYFQGTHNRYLLSIKKTASENQLFSKMI